MAITTPALYRMERGVLPDSAYTFADQVLRSEGIDPINAFVDQEVKRHHYAVASSFQNDVYRLQTLASLAFTDRILGSDTLGLSSATPEERIIARDFDSHQNRLHSYIPSVCKYIFELRTLREEL